MSPPGLLLFVSDTDNKQRAQRAAHKRNLKEKGQDMGKDKFGLIERDD